MVPRAGLVLASASPQRRAILTDLGVRFDVVPTDVEEERAGDPADVVIRNALAKAHAAREEVGPHRPVLGADTEVFLDGHVFGKPADEAEAGDFLEALSGRTHEVFSGLALVRGESCETGVCRSAVTFHRLDAPTIDRYVATGEWRGRAGGYAVQGEGGRLIAGIDGDYWNVVGLPTSLLLDMAPWLLPRR
ncbi:MAG: Maf family protein [Solirubrobacterales bacterium]